MGLALLRVDSVKHRVTLSDRTLDSFEAVDTVPGGVQLKGTGRNGRVDTSDDNLEETLHSTRMSLVTHPPYNSTIVK